MYAVDNELVKWEESRLYVSQGTYCFRWANCSWEMIEMNEMVCSIELIKGKPTEQDLTFAMLKGKIESS